MKPISPVIPGSAVAEIVFAEDQPEYLNLPAIRNGEPEGRVTTRWRLTWRERIKVFVSGDLWLQVLTFHNPLQPILLRTDCPRELAQMEGAAR